MTHREVWITIAVIAVSVSVFACQALVPLREPSRVVLHADSAEVPVHFNQHTYFAKIGFMFVNDTRQPLSRAGCGGPGWPALEKNVDGRWVAAYYPISLLCRSIPDFSVPPGRTYRNVLEFMATEPGQRLMPNLLVKSIDGIYRLRWSFAVGRKDEQDAKRVEAISNEFRMVLDPAAAPVSPGGP
jgi:hypothetical protein